MESNFSQDLLFLSGRFFTEDVPNDKQYLFKYFKNNLQKQFVRYYLMFGNTEFFTDHTGYVCSKLMLWRLAQKFARLENKKAAARKALDFPTITKIESGKYRFKN